MKRFVLISLLSLMSLIGKAQYIDSAYADNDKNSVNIAKYYEYAIASERIQYNSNLVKIGEDLMMIYAPSAALSGGLFMFGSQLANPNNATTITALRHTSITLFVSSGVLCLTGGIIYKVANDNKGRWEITANSIKVSW